MRYLRNFLRFTLRLQCRGWLLCLLVVLPARGEDQVYVVRRHDALSSIARRHGLSTAELAERNGISRQLQVYVGQHLRVPPDASPSANLEAKRAVSPLKPAVQKAIAKAPVVPHTWKYVVIHHSGMPEGSLKSIDRYHREERHMQHGMAYHFLIGNGRGMADGEIAVGNRWRAQLEGGHLRSEQQNKIALGICLVGNFDQTPPTVRQLRSLEALLRALLDRCDLSFSAVKTHREINIVRTDCPGSNFPTAALLASLKRSGR